MKKGWFQLAFGILGLSILMWSPNPHLNPVLKISILLIVVIAYSCWFRFFRRRKP